MPRHKQQPIADFGRELKHGYTRYKKYGCRCAVCCADMSAYGKAHYVPRTGVLRIPRAAESPKLISWWLDVSREAFADRVQTELPRMMAARITGRVSIPDSWGR